MTPAQFGALRKRWELEPLPLKRPEKPSQYEEARFDIRALLGELHRVYLLVAGLRCLNTSGLTCQGVLARETKCACVNCETYQKVWGG